MRHIMDSLTTNYKLVWKITKNTYSEDDGPVYLKVQDPDAV